MERWTRFVLRHRRVVLLLWLSVLVLGGIATVRIAPLFSNNFSVPGTPSARARDELSRVFGQKPEGTFTLDPTADPPLKIMYESGIRTENNELKVISAALIEAIANVLREQRKDQPC